jgi:hypothetical protein
MAAFSGVEIRIPAPYKIEENGPEAQSLLKLEHAPMF